MGIYFLAGRDFFLLHSMQQQQQPEEANIAKRGREVE
jgi:hypothetical protein